MQIKKACRLPHCRNFYLAGLLTLISCDMIAQSLSKNSVIRFLALGDSYTIGESVAEDQRWPVQLAQALAKKGYRVAPPVIIATTGWRTDQLKEAVTAKSPMSDYDLVSLLIGVNNQYQGRSISQYRKEFRDLLDMAVAHAGGNPSRVIVLSIPDYGYTPFGREKQAGISEAIDGFNAVNKTITERKGVTYIDITDISRRGLTDPELVADDGLHPSEKMYGLWVDRVMSSITAWTVDR